MKNLLTTGLFLAALLLAGALTSCEHKELLVPESKYYGNSKGSLIININSNPLGETRATVINDEISDATRLADEKTISTMALGVFDATGATKKDYQYLTDLTGTATNWKTVTSLKDKEDMVAGDMVYCVINVTQEVSDLLEAATTAEDFCKVASTIDQSLIFTDGGAYANDGTNIDAKKLPMYGSGAVTQAADNSKNFEVTINAKHMLAKVTLNSLTVSEVGSNTFTPKAIFLINVPEKLDFNFSTDGDEEAYQYTALNANFYQGESAAVAASTKVTDNNLTTRNYRDYLGTGALSIAAISSTVPMAEKFTFYTMPNNTAEPTRLVIYGDWYDASTTTTTPVWYTLDLKNVDYTVYPASLTLGLYPNRHYVVDVDIQRIGAVIDDDDATGAYTGLSTAQTVHSTYSLQDWDDGSKTSTFGGNGNAPTEA